MSDFDEDHDGYLNINEVIKLILNLSQIQNIQGP